MKMVFLVVFLVSSQVLANDIGPGIEVLVPVRNDRAVKGRVQDVDPSGRVFIDFGDDVLMSEAYGEQRAIDDVIPYKSVESFVVRNLFYYPRFTVKVGDKYLVMYDYLRDEYYPMYAHDITESGFVQVDFEKVPTDNGDRFDGEYIDAHEYLKPIPPKEEP